MVDWYSLLRLISISHPGHQACWVIVFIFWQVGMLSAKSFQLCSVLFAESLTSYFLYLPIRAWHLPRISNLAETYEMCTGASVGSNFKVHTKIWLYLLCVFFTFLNDFFLGLAISSFPNVSWNFSFYITSIVLIKNVTWTKNSPAFQNIKIQFYYNELYHL